MKKTLLIFVMLLSGVASAQTFTCNCDPISDGTRAERLTYVQTLATGNTTIIRSDDFAYSATENPNGDLFTITYPGTAKNYYPHRPNVPPYLYGFIEDLEGIYLDNFYLYLNIYVGEAQTDYNRNSPATASNTLSTQSQAEADALTSDDRYEMRTAELESLGYNNQIQVTTIKYLHRDGSHVIAITLPGTETSEFGNILKVFKAKDYGDIALDALSVGEFNDYYNASWIYIDNNY